MRPLFSNKGGIKDDIVLVKVGVGYRNQNLQKLAN